MLGKLKNTYYVYTAGMSPALSRRYVLECFKPSNAIKICNGIMLDFYLGLPHMQNKQVRTRGWCMSITIT